MAFALQLRKNMEKLALCATIKWTSAVLSWSQVQVTFTYNNVKLFAL